MTTAARGGDHGPARAREQVDELVAMISELAEYAEDPFSSGPDVDPDEVAGTSGQAQENRAVRVSHARSAAERARVARDGLHDLTVRARSLTAELRAQRVLREARLELTATERSTLADLRAAVPRHDDTRRARGIVAELLGCARAVPGVAHAGVTLWDRERAVVWAEASDEVGRALSAVQSLTGGPGRDAADTGAAVYAETEHVGDPAWDRFCDAATELGVRAVFSVPVHDGPHTGSLDLHTCAPDGLDDDARALGELLGRYVDIALRLRAATG